MFKTMSVIGVGAGCVLGVQLDTKVKLHYAPEKKTEEILMKCPSLSGNFQPCPWLFNGVLQAVYGGIEEKTKNIQGNSEYVEYETEELFTPDEGLISIDWKAPANIEANNKILFIVPGLTGSSHSQYIRCAVNEAYNRGYRVGVFNGRGIGQNRLNVIYK